VHLCLTALFHVTCIGALSHPTPMSHPSRLRSLRNYVSLNGQLHLRNLIARHTRARAPPSLSPPAPAGAGTSGTAGTPSTAATATPGASGGGGSGGPTPSPPPVASPLPPAEEPASRAERAEGRWDAASGTMSRRALPVFCYVTWLVQGRLVAASFVCVCPFSEPHAPNGCACV
jgi:hypothetical protein